MNSDLAELKQYVGKMAEDARNVMFNLLKVADEIEKYSIRFEAMSKTTQLASAKTLNNSFRTAQKEVLKATRALSIAADAGDTWCGNDAKQKVKTKTR